MSHLRKGISIIALSSLMLSGCAQMKEENILTGEGQFNETTTWATLGATGGAAIGGLGGAAGAAVGAAIGGLGGGYYGYNLDLAKEELSDEFEEYGIDVVDIDGVIHISIQNDLIFETGEYKINENNKEILDTFLNIISKIEEDFFVKVSGHTDNSGEKQYNISLSESRAKEVSMYLFKNGLPASSIDYRGFADLKPIADNSSEEGREKNRRVEIEIIPGIVKY